MYPTTNDINYVNIIDFIDQSIKFDIRTLLAITVIDFYRLLSIACFYFLALILFLKEVYLR